MESTQEALDNYQFIMPDILGTVEEVAKKWDVNVNALAKANDEAQRKSFLKMFNFTHDYDLDKRLFFSNGNVLQNNEYDIKEILNRECGYNFNIVTDYETFETFAAMYGWDVSYVENYYRWRICGGDDPEIPGAVSMRHLSAMHKALYDNKEHIRHRGYTLDCDGIHIKIHKIIRDELARANRKPKERKSHVGVSLSYGVLDALKKTNEIENVFIVDALKEYLSGSCFDPNEIEKYKRGTGIGFKTLNLTESMINNLTRACNGKRIKSKLVEIAIWRKLEKDGE